MSYGSRRLDRSAGPGDVRPGWLLDSAVRSIGPFINYPDGTVTDRARSLETPDCVLWRPGDPPGARPKNPAPEPYDKPHTPRGF
jgi:hypothetical protein